MLAKSQYAQNNYILSLRKYNNFFNKYKNNEYELDVRLLVSDILIKQEKYNDVLEQLLPLSIQFLIQVYFIDLINVFYLVFKLALVQIKLKVYYFRLIINY